MRHEETKLPAAVGFIVLLAVVACGIDCDEVAQDAQARKATWGSCMPGEECVVVDGYANDCTGQFGCAFVVSASQSGEARVESASLADQSDECRTCTRPRCPAAGTPTCEDGRCVFR